jgi:hypothetical protein
MLKLKIDIINNSIAIIVNLFFMYYIIRVIKSFRNACEASNIIVAIIVFIIIFFAFLILSSSPFAVI